MNKGITASTVAATRELQIDNEFKRLIPPLTPDEYSQLEQNILSEGIREKIVTWQGVVIDGHNRYEIAQKHGLEFETIEREFASREDVKIWIIKNQFGRRNLSAYDRSRLALELEPLISEKAKENQRLSEGKGLQKSENLKIEPVNTQKELATIAGVSHDTIAKVKTIEQKATPEVKEKLSSGEVSINQAYKEIKQAERKEEVAAKHEELKQKEIAPPSGLYDVVVIDPPWPIEKIQRDVRPNQVAIDYPVMSLDEISAMQIPAENDCHGFLWTTHKYLPAAFDILEKWGLKYVCTFTWHKPGGFQPIGLPQYNSEFCLYARKGTPIFTDTKAFNTCFAAERGKHSEKPEYFYDMIRRVTSGRRIDIFNRREIDGFDRWGNEAE